MESIVLNPEKKGVLKKICSKLTFPHLVFLILGIVAGYFFVFFTHLQCNKKYRFINQELGCENKLILDKKEYTQLKKEIIRFLDQKIEDGAIIKSAVYFRDLQNGPTFGINEKEPYIGASLLKLPLAITYLNLAEEEPDFLNRKLGYKPGGREPLAQSFIPKETLEPGRVYTIEELLRKLIVYSDNASFNLLTDYLTYIFPDEDKVLETYYELGLIEQGGGFRRKVIGQSLRRSF